MKSCVLWYIVFILFFIDSLPVHVTLVADTLNDSETLEIIERWDFLFQVAEFMKKLKIARDTTDATVLAEKMNLNVNKFVESSVQLYSARRGSSVVLNLFSPTCDVLRKLIADYESKDLERLIRDIFECQITGYSIESVVVYPADLERIKRHFSKRSSRLRYGIWC